MRMAVLGLDVRFGKEFLESPVIRPRIPRLATFSGWRLLNRARCSRSRTTLAFTERSLSWSIVANFLESPLGAGAALALTPELLRAHQQSAGTLIQRAIPSSGEMLPVISFGRGTAWIG